MPSDAYYVHRLLEQLQSLEQRLSNAVGANAALTQRCATLAQRMQKLIASADDNTLYSVFEVTLLPNLDALLIDANYHLKLRKYTSGVTGRPISSDRTGPHLKALEPPAVPQHLPNPKPEYNDNSRAKIEEALRLLKAFLN